MIDPIMQSCDLIHEGVVPVIYEGVTVMECRECHKEQGDCEHTMPEPDKYERWERER